MFWLFEKSFTEKLNSLELWILALPQKNEQYPSYLSVQKVNELYHELSNYVDKYPEKVLNEEKLRMKEIGKMSTTFTFNEV